MKKIVRFEIDPDLMPELKSKQQAEHKSLSQMPDESIDYSDIPALGDEFFENAVRNPFHKPQ